MSAEDHKTQPNVPGDAAQKETDDEQAPAQTKATTRQTPFSHRPSFRNWITWNGLVTLVRRRSGGIVGGAGRRGRLGEPDRRLVRRWGLRRRGVVGDALERAVLRLVIGGGGDAPALPLVLAHPVILGT